MGVDTRICYLAQTFDDNNWKLCRNVSYYRIRGFFLNTCHHLLLTYYLDSFAGTETKRLFIVPFDQIGDNQGRAKIFGPKYNIPVLPC